MMMLANSLQNSCGWLLNQPQQQQQYVVVLEQAPGKLEHYAGAEQEEEEFEDQLEEGIEDLQGEVVEDLQLDVVEDLNGEEVEDLELNEVENLQGEEVEDLQRERIEDHQEDDDKDQYPTPPLETLMSARLQCGIVYTWHCENELYGIECVLCEDRPMCKLHEFAEHIQIWHRNWDEDEGGEHDHEPQELYEDNEEGDNGGGDFVARRYVSDDDYAEAQMELDEYADNCDGDGVNDSVSHYQPFEEVLINNEPAEYDRDMQMMPAEGDEDTPTQDNEKSSKVLEEEDYDEYHKPVMAKYIKQVDENEEEQEEADDYEESIDYHNKVSHHRRIEIELSEDEFSRKSSLSMAQTIAEPVMMIQQGIGLNVNGPVEPSKSPHNDVNYGHEPATVQSGSDKENQGASSSSSSTSFSEGAESFEDLTDWRVLTTTRSQRRNSNESSQSRKNITQEQIGQLIDIYKEHPRLWNQSHPQFSVAKCNRHAWLEVTQRWNTHCQRNFSIHDVRTRVSTLCQRYMKERERLECVGETPRFTHYDRMQFLDKQQPMQSKRLYYEKLNSHLLEIYRDYPLLWHCSQKHLKCPEEREKALRAISAALKLKGIHFSIAMVTQRLRSLHKWYRDEKRRQLACKKSGVTFETKFKHYEQMHFLYKHTDPYVCDVCEKVYDTLPPYRDHMRATKHDQQHETIESFEKSTEEKVLDDKNDMMEDQNVIMEHQSEMFEDQMKMIAHQSQMVEVQTVMLEDGLDRLVDSTTRTPTPQDDDAELIDALLEDLSKEAEGASKTKEIALDSQTPKAFSQSDDENMVSSTTVLSSPPVELVAKVDCGSFSYQLSLGDITLTDTPTKQPSKSPSTALTEENIPKDEESFGRLNVEQTRQMIAVYQRYPQLWNPKHMDYQNRKLRRIAWRSLTNQINKLYKMRYSWKTMHRKLSDYVKYYKKECQRMTEENSSTKWCFFNNFAFLKELDGDATKGHGRLRDKDKSWKIIEVYKTFPQLWNTTHADFSKRRERQTHFEALRQRLKDEHNIELSTEKIRQRLIDYRCNYRMLKARRLASEKRNEPFIHQYEFYEALRFLEDHVAPFKCAPCVMNFERLTDFKRHNEQKHLIKCAASAKSSSDPNNNVCHICGLKFTARSNLVYHLKRHMGLYSHACTMCPKKFFNSTALRVHESSHTKKYPCVCDECGRAFVNMSKLNQHKKRHRNQKDHACDKCEKRFYTAFERDIHLRWHLQIRDKICNICGKGFVVGSSYYAHMLLHRETKRYSCNPCNLQFAQYAGLYKHRKAIHKV